MTAVLEGHVGCLTHANAALLILPLLSSLAKVAFRLLARLIEHPIQIHHSKLLRKLGKIQLIVGLVAIVLLLIELVVVLIRQALS